MKKTFLGMAVLSAMASTSAFAVDKVYDEASLNAAIAAANTDSSIHKIEFKRHARISLTAPVIYTGTQALSIDGHGAVIDGSEVGEREEFFDTVENVTTVSTDDGTLMFNTAANIAIKKLSVVNSYTRGIVVNIPSDAEGSDITVSLNSVNIYGSDLYGLHIDDNDSELDDGESGSAIGVRLNIRNSKFINNGTGAVDFDGVRVDEREEGSITANIINTQIDRNGGDGIELDEAGAGDVKATMFRVSLNENGGQNPEDLDDGFDIDEAGEGDIDLNLIKVDVRGNLDEGLDFDETGPGSVHALFHNVVAFKNTDEAVKIDEEDAGDINVTASKLTVISSGDDGIQFTELGQGAVQVTLDKVKSINNDKYGIKIEQWLEEDEANQVEEKGSVQILNKVNLRRNGKGDEIKTHGVIVD